MALRVTCPNPACGGALSASEEAAGKVAHCPHCGGPLVIPQAQEPATPSVLPPRPALSADERAEIFQRAQCSSWRNTAVWVGALALVVGLAAWRVSAYFARQGVYEKLLAAAKDNGKEGQAIAEELAPDLGYVVSCANEFFERAEGKMRVCMDNGLCAVIVHLPPEADLDPLLELTDRAASSYRAALRVVAARADSDWLLERSCARSEAVRVFAAAALGPSLPLGRCSEAQAARLAERMGLEEKRQVYAEIGDGIHGELEAAWVGRYAVSIDAAWQTPFAAPRPAQWTSREAPLTVACEGRTWQVAFLGQKWSGTVDELPGLGLSCPAPTLLGLTALAPPYSAVRSSTVTVQFKDGFRVGIHPVPMYERERMLSSPMSRRGSLPPGATILGHGIRNRDGFPTPEIKWVRPARTGFASFKVALVRR
ncbi:hypothetical protein HQ560_12820 [bacterium]|nr:hypothetical protein [bacterium]